jgi:hypothetical protein
MEIKNNKINRGLLYLKQAVYNFDTKNTYTLALSLYAFKLADERKSVISEIEVELDKRAVVQGDLKYWKENDVETEAGTDSFYKPQSADIETTSYILLAKLHNLDTSQTASILPIVKWINSQRNSLGGFYSTQVCLF